MTQFVTAVYPDPLNISLPSTQYKIVLAEILNDETLKVFQAYQLIQRVLVQSTQVHRRQVHDNAP